VWTAWLAKWLENRLHLPLFRLSSWQRFFGLPVRFTAPHNGGGSSAAARQVRKHWRPSQVGVSPDASGAATIHHCVPGTPGCAFTLCSFLTGWLCAGPARPRLPRLLSACLALPGLPPSECLACLDILSPPFLPREHRWKLSGLCTTEMSSAPRYQRTSLT